MHLVDDRSGLDDLVDRAQRGERRAAASLYQQFHAPIFRQAYMLVQDADVAHDITQEAFARALVRLDAYEPARAAFTTWMHGFVINLAREHWRHRQRRVRLVDRLKGAAQRDAPDLEARLGIQEGLDALSAALARLPESQREAVVLVDLQQLSPDEAAARLGTTAGNVRVRAHRGRKRLRALLDDGGVP